MSATAELGNLGLLSIKKLERTQTRQFTYVYV